MQRTGVKILELNIRPRIKNVFPTKTILNLRCFTHKDSLLLGFAKSQIRLSAALEFKFLIER